MESLLLFFNFFSAKYFLILAVVFSILLQLTRLGKHFKTFKSHDKYMGFFGYLFAFFFMGLLFNAFALAIVYLGTWFSELEAGTNLGGGEKWWYITRWTSTGYVVVIFYDISTQYFQMDPAMLGTTTTVCAKVGALTQRKMDRPMLVNI